MLSGIFGNATEASKESVEQEINAVLVPGEEVTQAYRLIRDLYVFTDRRLILIDKQGLTGKKVEYHSIPYRSITHFAVETNGRFDLDAELKIWISGTDVPIAKEFRKSSNILDVQRTLAHHVLR